MTALSELHRYQITSVHRGPVTGPYVLLTVIFFARREDLPLHKSASLVGPVANRQADCESARAERSSPAGAYHSAGQQFVLRLFPFAACRIAGQARSLRRTGSPPARSEAGPPAAKGPVAFHYF